MGAFWVYVLDIFLGPPLRAFGVRRPASGCASLALCGSSTFFGATGRYASGLASLGPAQPSRSLRGFAPSLRASLLGLRRFAPHPSASLGLRRIIALGLVGWLWVVGALGLSAQDLPRSHAHNDYEKIGRRSLTAALELGFRSIEIDVFCHRGKLRIAHIPLFLGLRPQLERRYFKRVERWLAEHPRDSLAQPIILMIDIKNRPEEMYARLRVLCERYAHLLCVYYPKENRYKSGPVQILLSGSKPVAALQRDSVQYMWLDMGLGTIGDKNIPAQLAPRVSAHYRSQFKWRGRGPMPEAERLRLVELLSRAHADGREVRFWAMPDRPAVWEALSEAGVDWLNIDRLKRYRRWHRHKTK